MKHSSEPVAHSFYHRGRRQQEVEERTVAKTIFAMLGSCEYISIFCHKDTFLLTLKHGIISQSHLWVFFFHFLIIW